MKQLTNYTNYILKQLDEIPTDTPKLAVYNTGSGLSICPELGSEISIVEIIRNRFMHIQEPKTAVGVTDEEWDECWGAALNIANGFIVARNNRR